MKSGRTGGSCFQGRRAMPAVVPERVWGHESTTMKDKGRQGAQQCFRKMEKLGNLDFKEDYNNILCATNFF